MKHDDQISNLIVGLLLELKEIVHFEKEKHLLIENLSAKIDNYHNLFTNLKDNLITILIESSKLSHRESKKRKVCTYEKITRSPVNNIDAKNLKKILSFLQYD